jgi:hydrogenase maturation protease
VYTLKAQPSQPKSDRILVIGIGNPNRSDDGLGLYVVNAINQRLGRSPVGEEVAVRGGEVQSDGRVGTVFVQQLGPEIVDEAKDYDLVFFVDAHTGAYEEEIRAVEVAPAYEVSAFSHHMEPSAVLALAKMLYNHLPRGIAMSVRGYDFDFGQELSPKTKALADQVVERIMGILANP